MDGNGKYSLIIIGAGITGLSTALAWTKVYSSTAKPVLLIERNAIPGGCVSTFAREGYRFDTTQIIPDVTDLLEYFEVDIALKKFDNYYARLFLADPESKTARIIPVPSEKEHFEETLTGLFPADASPISRFFRYCQSMHNELEYLKTEPKWHQLPGILLRCRKIIANSGKTYHQFLDSFNFTHQEARQVLDIFSSFSGLSGDRCAALLTACAMITTLKGSYRPEKGFIQFPVALMKKLKERGVEFRMNTEVSRILTGHGKVKGVQLVSGEILHAEYVVSTADTKVTFDKMLDIEGLGLSSLKYFRKAKAVRMSPSGFAIHLGLDGLLDLDAMGFNCGYNVLTSGPDAHPAMFDAWERGQLLTSDEKFHLAVICPSLMTGGKQNLIIHVVPAPAEKWTHMRSEDPLRYKKEKMDIAEFYIRKVEEYMIPDLKDHILFTDIATPATYSRFIGSPTGSQYDMLPLPSNFGKNRLPTRTPVKGLFVPKFSHGIWPSMQAGLQVVDMISGGKIMNGNSSYRPGKG